jgi:hypothetical protein
MAERAAHLIDHVLPEVPVRQWVLTVPYRLRYRLAWDHQLCRAVVAIFMRAVLGWLRRRARLNGVPDGRGGAILVIQRFGGGLNLNLHLHALVLDGVFTREASGRPRFVAAPPLNALDVAEVLASVVPRLRALLTRRGLGDTETPDLDVWSDVSPALATAAAASVQGLVAGGSDIERPLRIGTAIRVDAGQEDGTARCEGCHARADGFDLHADVRVGARQRDRLEQVCRYALRPAVAGERLRLTPQGRVRLRLRHPYRDGTTHLVFEPVALLARLAVLIPRPRVNLVLYHGVLAPRAAWRREVVPLRVSAGAGAGDGAGDNGRSDGAGAPALGANYRWAELMRHTFGIDVLSCPRCGGRLRLVALVHQTAVAARILTHLGLPADVPAAARAAPDRSDESDLF